MSTPTPELAAHELWLSDHSRTIAAHADALDETGKWVGRIEVELANRPHTSDLEALRRRVDALELTRSVQTFMEWIRQARLTTSPRVSVITPTHNRAAMLPAAIASVQAQTYSAWELIVVDDASSDSTPEVLATVDDPRVRSLRLPHGGVAAARNAGLDAATGEIIAYLDDDNTMHPSWLRSVVWALEQRPEIDILYGALILDDLDRVEGRTPGGLPALYLRPYDRQALLTNNLTDISAIAHRAHLPGARFDESLNEMDDWDLLCTLTATREPLVLPAIACFYTSHAANRLSNGPTNRADYDTVRRKHLPRED